ncbi:MAG: diacylglycerol kinase family lipid kinase, partial [Gemmatimonadota bacterium]
MVSGGDADLRAAGDDLSGSPHGERRTFVIFNPASGRGRGARRIGAYRALLARYLPDAAEGVTERPGGERDLADRALAEGYEVIAAAGGDGTWSNVADRVLASGRDDVAFAMLPNGTGNDFGRSLGFRPGDAEEAVQALAQARTRLVDAGRLDTPSASEHDPERMEPRHFLNLVGFGFDIAVIDAAARARFLKGELLYKITALQQLFRFPGVSLRLKSGAGEARHGRHLMLTVSNGRYFGGGFPIAPDATVEDGRLHACRIQDAPPLSRLRLFNLAEKGRHVTSPRVEVLDDRAFHIAFDEPPRFEIDGDVRQAAEAELSVRILPRALRVV